MMIDFVVRVKRLFVGKFDRLWRLAAGDDLDAASIESQRAEVFSGADRVDDRRGEHIEELRFFSEEVFHLCHV